GVSWAGTVLLVKPEEEESPAISDLSEAMYVYGYPLVQGLGQGGPEMVQVLGKQQRGEAAREIEVASVDSADEGFVRLWDSALSSDDGLVGKAALVKETAPDASTLSPVHERLLAKLDGEPAGVLALHCGELIGRVLLLWVEPDLRGRGAGIALLDQACALSEQKNHILLCAWTHRDGMLRYFLGKRGFEHRLNALYFLKEK
ncbi:GNAT family N-acetyltransferase, partial [bacterium]|nr:GNAT family N-acetyltransferase [bacterium]